MTNFPAVGKVSVDLLGCGGVIPVSCTVCGGVLAPALTAVKIAPEPPEGVACAGYSQTVGMYFAAAADGIYATQTGVKYVKLSEKTGGNPFFFEEFNEGKYRAVTVRDGGAVVYEKDGFLLPAYEYKFTCGTVHCGRFFGADAENGCLLRWSGEGGISDWTEGLYGSGNILLDPERGAVLDILEYGEKLVIVRKFGLTVLNAYGAPENFAAEMTDTDTDEVFAGTARVAGGRLFFYTQSGLYSYSDGGVARVKHRLDGHMREPTCSQAFGNRYFLACGRGDAYAVMCYDTDLNDSYFIDIKANAMCINGGVCVFCDDGIYRLCDGENWSVYADGFDFGKDGKKTLTGIYVAGNADITVGNGKVVRSMGGVSGLVRPGLRGASFSIRIDGSGRLERLTVTGETSIGI